MYHDLLEANSLLWIVTFQELNFFAWRYIRMRIEIWFSKKIAQFLRVQRSNFKVNLQET